MSNKSKKITIPASSADGSELEPIEVEIEVEDEIFSSKSEKHPSKNRTEPSEVNVQFSPDDSKDDKRKLNCCRAPIPMEDADMVNGEFLEKHFTVSSHWDPSEEKYRYKLKFDPTQKYKNVMQGYCNYVKTIYPCVKGLGSSWSLVQGNWGQGWTTRLMGRTIWAGFVPHTTQNTFNIAGSFSHWDEYCDAPTHINTNPLPLSSSNALDFNTTYAIGVGHWVSFEKGCNISEEKRCFEAHRHVNFRFSTSQNTL